MSYSSLSAKIFFYNILFFLETVSTIDGFPLYRKGGTQCQNAIITYTRTFLVFTLGHCLEVNL